MTTSGQSGDEVLARLGFPALEAVLGGVGEVHAVALVLIGYLLAQADGTAVEVDDVGCGALRPETGQDLGRWQRCAYGAGASWHCSGRDQPDPGKGGPDQGGADQGDQGPANSARSRARAPGERRRKFFGSCIVPPERVRIAQDGGTGARLQRPLRLEVV